MRIFIAPDSTEYPQGFEATVLPNLEEDTGADLLLSIERFPLPPNNDALLRKHCETGMLVQVKNGNDIQESITNERLFQQVRKMLQYSSNSWVLSIGTLFDVNGKCAVGKLSSKQILSGSFGKASVSGRLGIGYMSLKAAVNAARYAGAYVDDVVSLDYFVSWLESHERILIAKKAGEAKELTPRGVQREIVGAGYLSWLSAMFDGVGKKTAQRAWEIVEHLTDGNPSLTQAVGYLLTYQAQEIPGITGAMIQGWRDLWGLKTNVKPALYQALAYEWRSSETESPLSFNSMFRADARTIFTADALQGIIGQEATVYAIDQDEIKGKLVSIVLRDERDAVLWIEVGKLEEKAVLLKSIIDIQLKGVDYG